MDVDSFWDIIDATHSAAPRDMDRKCGVLADKLMVLDEAGLRDFITHFDAADVQAYTWSLWGAIYLIRGGCGDDAFSDFRATLISMGRETFEAALADPDSLVGVEFAGEDPAYEGFQYVPTEVAEKRLGSVPPRPEPFPSNPSGTGWSEDELERLFPRLAAKYAGPEPPRPAEKPWWKFW